MITTITCAQFVEAFHQAGRGDSFTRAGLEVIFDSLTDLSADTPIALDPIAICCDFTEYDADDLRAEYPDLADDPEDDDAWLDAAADKGGVMVECCAD